MFLEKTRFSLNFLIANVCVAKSRNLKKNLMVQYCS